MLVARKVQRLVPCCRPLALDGSLCCRSQGVDTSATFSTCSTSYSTYNIRRPMFKTEVETDCDRALRSFDATYAGVYGSQWPSIRLALLTQQKYAAVINNVNPHFDDNVLKFKELGCVDVGETYMAERAKFLESKSKLIRKEIKDRKRENKVLKQMKEDPLNNIPRFQMSGEDRYKLEEKPKPDHYPVRYKERREYLDDSRPPASDRVLPPSPSLEGALPDLQDFVPPTKLLGTGATSLEEDSYLKFREDLESERGPTSSVEHPPAPPPWPPLLTVLAFPRGVVATFPKPSMEAGVSDHFALDAGSVLPVLLLQPQEGDTVLDMCAAPGGKTLILLQTSVLGGLQSNDLSASHAARISSLVDQFYGKAQAHHRITDVDARILPTPGEFSRVLLDAPCSTDRQSLVEPSNNIFRQSRLKKRLALPERQSNLLVAAAKQAKVGGTIVYTTCSLSPMQNDGVVHMALNKLWDYSGIQCTVVNYTPVLAPLSFMFRVAGEELGLRYGHVVLPAVANNYGPTYVAKLIRTK